MPLINASEVRTLFDQLLSTNNEDGESIEVEGVLNLRAFSLTALEQYSDAIAEICVNIKEEVFDSESGNDYISHVSAQYDKNGVRWTGDPDLVDKLIVVGLAAERIIQLNVPRVVHSRFFPDGKPLYRVIPRIDF